ALPVIVPEPIRFVHPPEGHLDLLTDVDLCGVTISHLHIGTAAALEIDYRHNGRRIGIGIQKVQRECEHSSGFIRESNWLKVILFLASNAHSLSWILPSTTGQAAVAIQSIDIVAVSPCL